MVDFPKSGHIWSFNASILSNKTNLNLFTKVDWISQGNYNKIYWYTNFSDLSVFVLIDCIDW